MGAMERVFNWFMGAAAPRAGFVAPDAAAAQPLREAFGVTIDADDDQWRPLTGDTNRDLTPLTQARMQKIAAFMWERNPLANRLIELVTAYLLGEGVKLTCKNEDGQALLRKFWRDPINKLGQKLAAMVRECELYGEQCYPVFVNEQTGFVRLGYLDPSLIEAASIVYLEGYLFDRTEAKEAFKEAARLARKSGAKVALTLSDAFCVDRHRDDFRKLIREGIDIVFANAKEITSLYEVNSFAEAADAALADCELAVLTRSNEGSVIVANGETIAIAPETVSEAVDVTGAGDLYASGFLYGLTQGLPLETCGRLGSLAAAEVIGHIGARPEMSLRKLAQERGLLSD